MISSILRNFDGERQNYKPDFGGMDNLITFNIQTENGHADF